MYTLLVSMCTQVVSKYTQPFSFYDYNTRSDWQKILWNQSEEMKSDCLPEMDFLDIIE